MNKEYLINTKDTLKKAMKKIDGIKPKILFVVDDNKLMGTLTDGDIRRYLANGGSISDMTTNACNKNPKIAKNINEAKSLYSKDFIAIPIVKNSKLIDIYIGKRDEITEKLNIPVVINAGGKGTRLEPFTKVLPKPLIPVGDLPIMEHMMQRFELFDCKKFYAIVNYKKQLIKAYFKECDNKYKLTCVDEDLPLGTAGGLSLLKNKVNETFFFVNCDTLLMSNYSDILKFHEDTKSDITMVCASKNITIPFGVVDINKNKTLKKMKEKPNYSFLTNVGFYVIEPSILKDLKNNERIDMPDLIKLAQNNGKKVSIYSVGEEDWLDMGQMSELERMRQAVYGKQ